MRLRSGQWYQSREEHCATKDAGRSQPVVHGKWVLEEEDREDQADKLAQSNDQSDSQRRAGCRQVEDTANTHVLGEDVAQEQQPEVRYVK